MGGKKPVAVKESLETRGRVQCEVRLSLGGYSFKYAWDIGDKQLFKTTSKVTGPTLPFHKDEDRIAIDAILPFNESGSPAAEVFQSKLQQRTSKLAPVDLRNESDIT